MREQERNDIKCDRKHDHSKIQFCFVISRIKCETKCEKMNRLTQKRFMKNDYPIECGKLRSLR